MHKDKKEKEGRCREKKTSKYSPLFLSAFLKLLRAKKHLGLKLLMLLPNVTFISQ